MTNPGFHGTEYTFAFISLGGERVALRYSMSLLVCLAAFLPPLAFLSRAKKSFKEIKWLSVGAIGLTALIAAIAFHLMLPNKSKSVRLYYGNAELNGQTIEVTYTPENDERSEPGTFVLKDIRAEQLGQFPTDEITIILYFSDKVICEPGLYECHPIPVNEGFSSGFRWDDLSPITPKRSWTAPPFRGIAQGSLPNAMKARLKIFYGEASPAVANFTINVRDVGTH